MKIVRSVLFGLGGIFLLCLFFSCKNISEPLSHDRSLLIQDLYNGLEFSMPVVQEPSIPDNGCYVTEFGAIGNGIANNREAFEKAIEAMVERGGGRVVVPRGIWLTGPIVLKSNIDLHLDAGALIIFSKDFDEYPIIKTSFEGLETYRCLSPISGNDLENIAITGEGIIDGSGDAWRPVKREKMTDRQWRDLIRSGGVVSDDGRIWYPSEKSKNGDRRDNFNVPNFSDPEKYESVKDFLRPVMVSLVRCKKVLIDGPTFQNSPAWNIHPLMCEDVIMRNTTVRNPWYSQNGDGLDLESCKNALIYNNNFDVGDDAICFKSGKDEDGRKRGMPTENVIVTNNIVFHGHGGFTVGSETSGGMKNVHISNCTFIGTDIGLRFKSTRGRGGVVENIYISNIDMINIPTEAIRFNLFYEGESPIPDNGEEVNSSDESEITHVEADETTPSFRNIHMRNIKVSRSKTAAFFQGLPEMKLQNVSLENSVFESEEGITIIDADGMIFKDVTVAHEKGVVLTVYNSKNIEMNDFEMDTENSTPLIRILGKETNAIRFRKSDIKLEQIKMSQDVPENAVIFDDAL